MEDARDGAPQSFDVARCIDSLKKILKECDGAGRTRVALHITEAIDALEREMRGQDQLAHLGLFRLTNPLHGITIDRADDYQGVAMPANIDEMHLAGQPAVARATDYSELRAIALRLLAVAERAEASRATAVADPKHVETVLHTRTRPTLEEPTLAFLRSLALFIYGSRRRRAKHFDESMFGEAAWDMLLDLFIHATEGKRVGTKSVCVGSGVPPTTALRWMAALEEKGWVHREQSETDARVTFVRLSDTAFEAMKGYLMNEISAFAYQQPTSFMLRD